MVNTLYTLNLFINNRRELNSIEENKGKKENKNCIKDKNDPRNFIEY